MAAVRSFFRYLDRAPRRPQPGAAGDAHAAPATPRAAAAGRERRPRPDRQRRTEAREPWLGLRDTALLLLLYGAGLRIGEALALDRRAVGVDPRALRSLRVRGKGDKERLVPVLPIVADGARGLSRRLPVPPPRRRAAVQGRARRPAAARRWCRSRCGSCAAPGPARDRDAACAAPQLRDPPAGGRRRSARDPGAAGPRQPVDHAGLHRGRRRAPDALYARAHPRA